MQHAHKISSQLHTSNNTLQHKISLSIQQCENIFLDWSLLLTLKGIASLLELVHGRVIGTIHCRVNASHCHWRVNCHDGYPATSPSELLQPSLRFKYLLNQGCTNAMSIEIGQLKMCTANILWAKDSTTTLHCKLMQWVKLVTCGCELQFYSRQSTI